MQPGAKRQRVRKYTDAELDEFAEAVKRDGHVMLRQVIDPEKLKNIRQAYRPVLEARIRRAGADRGSQRFYATPPFLPPFWDPDIFQNPDILGVVKRLVGDDVVMCQFAGDTPLKGSEYQTVHRDAAPLYPEDESFPEPPATQLGVNFPLCDVLPPTEGHVSNGPLEVADGTHRLSLKEGLSLIASSDLSLKPVHFNLGDVLVRDVRGLHRGTPNLSDDPREMIVIGYSRSWLRRPEVGLRVKQSLFQELDEDGRSLLRFESIVADKDFGEYPGEGWSPVYDAASLEKTSGSSFKG